MDLQKLYQECLDVFGAEQQLSMAIEECAELIEAICHYRRSRIPIERLASEVADVELMVAQLRVMIGDVAVDVEKDYKIRRLRERIGQITKLV